VTRTRLSGKSNIDQMMKAEVKNQKARESGVAQVKPVEESDGEEDKMT
jgi:hypothetical protein